MPEPTQRLLVSQEVAELLQVHPKQIYRLLARGLPGRRVGREWRFDRTEVLRWVDGSPPGSTETVARALPDPGTEAPPLVAANGDLAVELLLGRLAAGDVLFGFVQSDRDGALELLRLGRVLFAGCHGREPPEHLGAVRLARIHLVVREVGLAAARGAEVPSLERIDFRRFAGRPRSAGIRGHLERALREAGIAPDALGGAHAYPSHRDVVHAVARGDADSGLATRAWADRLGLSFRPLTTESYGLVVRASDLGDPRVVAVCEVAQSPDYRAELAQIAGYDANDSGAVQYHFGSGTGGDERMHRQRRRTSP